MLSHTDEPASFLQLQSTSSAADCDAIHDSQKMASALLLGHNLVPAFLQCLLHTLQHQSVRRLWNTAARLGPAQTQICQVAGKHATICSEQH